MGVTRRNLIAAAGLGALAGCVSGGDDRTRTSTSTGEPPGPAKPIEDGSIPLAETRLPLSQSPEDFQSHAVSGGPPKDGIPSIDDPSFVDSGDVDFLEPGDPVFGVERNGVRKAYPQKILVHHEIVNDHLGDLPVAVTYCPLTGTVLGFERGETTFGVSGRLINNNLVMYDRETETWWPQILATSIPGPWNPDPEIASLREFKLVWTSWERWQDAHPETQVLSRETGSVRNYDNDPYGSYNPPGGYYTSENTLFGTLETDDRFDRKRVFFGARTAAGAVAFDTSTLLEDGVMTGELDDTPVVAVADQPLQTGYVYLNPSRRTVTVDDDTIIVGDTSSEPNSLPLERIHTFDAMWFAWHGYYPETSVYA